MGNITTIKEVSKSSDALADKLVKIADEIRGENPYGIFRIVLVLEGSTTVDIQVLGKESTKVERLGLLEYAKLITCRVDMT
jgi:hypothetical protein